MQNQAYNIVMQEKLIQITKNGELVYEISLSNKSINLKELYDKMQVNIDDEYFFAQGLQQFTAPQNDAERIFNNVYQFMSRLLGTLNNKLKDLRERQETSIFI